MLKNAIVDPAAQENYAIWIAAVNGHLKVVERLLQDERVDPSAQDNQAIRGAAAFNRLSVIDRLLQDLRVDPSTNKNEAIRSAAYGGDLLVVDRLMRDSRVDPSSDDNYAVKWAAMRRHVSVVDRLLEDDRVDAKVAIRFSRPEHLKRFEYRERLTEICIALQDLRLPAWITMLICKAARPWSTLPIHKRWKLVCTVKHFHEKRTLL